MKTDRKANSVVLISCVVGQILVVAVLLALSEDVGSTSQADILDTGLQAVSITAGGYLPAEVTIAQGTKVKWTNGDTVTHTVTSQTLLWDSGDIAPGSSYTRTFGTTGVYPYQCSYYPTLVGTITVNSQVYLPAVGKNYAAPSQGGTLNLTNLHDVEMLNPFMASDMASQEVMGFLFESAFETDPWTGELTPGLVESWVVADGNLTVTYNVRHGANWSDGEAITAHDYKFMFDALMAKDDGDSPALPTSPRLDMVEGVETVELLSDYALRVTYSEPYCANVDKLNLPWWPSHVFLGDPSFEFADLADHSFGYTASVVSGPFLIDEWVRDDHIALVRNADYWRGAPYLDGVMWKVVADSSVERAMVAAGEVDLIDITSEHLSEMEQLPGVSILKFLQRAYDFIGLQQGDPTDPQPRLNGDGTVNENHGVHPVLGKKEVRQALVYATDRTTIIEQARLAQAELLHAHIPPLYAWAYNDALVPRDYDPVTAASMLEAAGWELNVGTGIRECQGCGTAPDGTPMQLTLKTNAGNQVRETIMQLVQQQWSQVGIDVEVETVEWGLFLDTMLGQTFDAVIIGWTGVDEDNETLFFAKYDVPGGGFNFCSFYRPDYEPLEIEAKTLPGCSYTERGAIYREIQEIFYDEQPYVFLYAPYAIHVISDRIGGVQAGPWDLTHDIHKWYIGPGS